MSTPSEDKIKSLLSREGATANVTCLETVDSTNLEVKRRMRAGAGAPLLITADAQTAGRGRLGRDFYSPPVSGAYFSVGLYAKDLPGSPVAVTSAAAVAVSRAIFRATGLDPRIKWVNDVYLNGGKVCGILAESFSAPGGTAVVVGIGINVTTEHFPPELAATAASLGTGAREELIALSTAELMRLAALPPGEYMDEYRARSMVIGRRIAYGPPGELTGEAEAVGIDDDGGLIIRLKDGTEEVLRTGEITIRLR